MDYINDLFFAFKGRIRRRDFWLGCIVILLLEALLVIALTQVFELPVADLAKTDMPDEQWIALYDKVGSLGALANVIFLWPWIAVIGKRCHDRNKSSWWVLLAYIPIIGNLWSFVELACLSGTPGTNRFGIDPTLKA